MKVFCCFDATYYELIKSYFHLVDCSVSISVPNYELADHTVIIRRYRVVLVDVAIHSHVAAAWADIFCDLARAWSEGVWILSCDPALDRMAF